MYLSTGKRLTLNKSETGLCCAIMLAILQVHQASCPTKLNQRVERSRARMPGHQLLQVALLHALQMPAGL